MTRGFQLFEAHAMERFTNRLRDSLPIELQHASNEEIEASLERLIGRVLKHSENFGPMPDSELPDYVAGPRAALRKDLAVEYPSFLEHGKELLRLLGTAEDEESEAYARLHFHDAKEARVAMKCAVEEWEPVTESGQWKEE